MSERWCGHCGTVTPEHELAPMSPTLSLLVCASCRARVAVTGHHQTPFQRRAEGSTAMTPHERKHAEILAKPPVVVAGADVAEVV